MSEKCIIDSIVISICFVSLGRQPVENNTSKYTKPIQFTPQLPSNDSSSQTQIPVSTKNTFQPVKKQIPSRKRPAERRQAINDHLAKFCDQTLQPNKYSNFILVDLSGESNSFQIVQNSAAKQKAILNVTYAMKGSEMYLKAPHLTMGQKSDFFKKISLSGNVLSR